QAGLSAVLGTAVVQVAIDVAREARRRQFGKIVSRGLLVGSKCDELDVVVDRCVAAGGACFFAAIEIVRRLQLANGIRGTGRQIGEGVVAVGIGNGRLNHIAIGIEQLYGDARNAVVAAVENDVIVMVGEDAARQRSW